MLLAHRQAIGILLIALFCPIQLSASTVLIFVTPHGIVMSTDSKTSTRYSLADNTTRIGEGITRKFVLVQDRILVATIGNADIRRERGSFHYNFLAWMEELKARLPNDISVDDLASAIQTESAKVFAGFDAVLKSDVLKRNYATETCTSFVEYIIAGYQNGSPRVYAVQFYIDWNEKRLAGPLRIVSYSGEQTSRNFHADFFGIKEALTDILDRHSYAHKQALMLCPKAFSDLVARRDVSLNETIALARTFVQIEENTNPGDVGGTIQMAKVLPSGHAYNVIDDLTKAETGKHKSH